MSAVDDIVTTFTNRIFEKREDVAGSFLPEGATIDGGFLLTQARFVNQIRFLIRLKGSQPQLNHYEALQVLDIVRKLESIFKVFLRLGFLEKALEVIDVLKGAYKLRDGVAIINVKFLIDLTETTVYEGDKILWQKCLDYLEGRFHELRTSPFGVHIFFRLYCQLVCYGFYRQDIFLIEEIEANIEKAYKLGLDVIHLSDDLDLITSSVSALTDVYNEYKTLYFGPSED